MLVSLNPLRDISRNQIMGEYDYDHPVFDRAAIAAQAGVAQLQGQRRTWFCGSYLGHGFHEDALQSGLAVAEQLGDVRRPWSVGNESGRIHVRTPKLAEAAA